MFRIAVCDDEEAICSHIENVILTFKKEALMELDIDVFYSGEEIYEYLKKGNGFDLIFLDIEMKLLNGVEVGKKIREEMDNQLTQIVYVSGKDKYYKELFEVRPMHFLSKPIESDKIIKDVRLAMKLTNRLGGTFSYKKDYKTFKIPIKSIIYFESIDREIKIVCDKYEDLFYGKLEDIYNQLAKYQFMYIHKSYIINYFHVIKYRYQEVQMSNLVVLPISQPRRKEIRELQIKYENEGMN